MVSMREHVVGCTVQVAGDDTAVGTIMRARSAQRARADIPVRSVR
jgi:hypothetical protein